MAEEKASGVKSVISGWIKAVCTSVFGLVTGAVMDLEQYPVGAPPNW